MPPDIPDNPGDDSDVDRKALRALRQRFFDINAGRLEALRGRLIPDHRTFVDALPVLLHSNHAALPGFVDFDTPSGIDRFTPSRATINAVRKIALSFTQERFVERRAQILGVYVAATGGDGESAALEVTVCCARAAHAQLGLKLSRIVRFAADLGLPVSTKLMDPADESAQPGTPHTPLLDRDRFYRTAILLAGRYPVWWLVPPDRDDQHEAYCARLKAQRFIGRDETLDLGPLRRIPRAECLVAGIAQLAAALAAPYAHLHELLLLEHYANDPDAMPLARLYKSHLWDDDRDVESTLLAHESVAAYLTRLGEHDRLDLARHCLLATSADNPRLRELTASWQWSEAQLRHARGDRDLTIAELEQENARVNAELLRAYSHLTQLAADNGRPLRARLDEIGSRLDRIVDRREGTIPRMNAALLPKRVTGRVRVEPHQDAWRLHDGARAVFAAPRLATLMAWAHLHRLRIENLRVEDADRRHCCARMLDLFAAHIGDMRERLQLLVINSEESPLAALKSHGDALLSEWDDPLDFSGFHTSLVAGIDAFDVRADGITPRAYVGDDGLIDALTDLANDTSPDVHVVCAGGDRPRAVEERIVALLAEMTGAFANPDRAGRFVFALAEGFVVMERGASRIHARRCENEEQLYQILASPLRGRTLHVDPRNGRLDGLLQLCRMGSPDRDVLLVHEHRGVVQVLLMTRDGAVRHFEPPQRPAHDIAEQAIACLARLAQRRGKVVRAPLVCVAKNRAAPTTVTASHTAASPAIDGISTDALRRGLAATLAELFALERESAGRPTHA